MRSDRIPDGPFWTFFASLPVGAVLFDPEDDGFVEFNDAACAQLGYSREAFSRLRVGDIDTLRSGAEIQRARKQLRPQAGPQHFHTLQRAADGRFREVDVTLQCIELDGKLLGYAVWHDVTEREEAIAALRSREADLARVQRIGRIGGFAIDLVDNFTSHRSPEYLSLHQLPPEAATETHDAWVQRLHPEDRERMDRFFRDTVAGSARDYAAEYRVLTPEGDTRWISAVAEIERDPAGRPLRMVGAHIDVTALRQAESTLASHAARLEEADRRKDEFLAMLGHELRNPLAPILSVSEMLRRRQSAFASDVADAHEVIDRQARHLQVLVDELLDVARVTTGRIALTREGVDVRAMVQAAVEQAQDLITRQGHRFHADLPPLPARLFVTGDPARLIQVVSNLLNNAAKYTEPGGEIHLSVTCDDAEVGIAVQDTGIGILPETLPHIFDAFAQFDRHADHSRSGLGIGLTLAHRLIGLHGGSITAQSDGPGRGSRFAIRLPRDLASGSAVASSAPVAPAEPAEPPARRMGRRVLLVDDNVDAADSMAMLIRLEGHEVLALHDGFEVVEQAISFQPDIALLDLGLPGRDGFQIARDLRSIAGLKDLVLVAVTGYGQDEDRRRTREAGFSSHLVKPVDLPELLQLLSTTSDARRGRADF